MSENVLASIFPATLITQAKDFQSSTLRSLTNALFWSTQRIKWKDFIDITS